MKLTIIGLLFWKRYLTHPSGSAVSKQSKPVVKFPLVCVQLPVYNEPKHIGPLIRTIADIDWPDDRLEVQVLDDSTDGTTELAKTAISEVRLARPNLAIQHLQREQREGYKAGALDYGRKRSQAEYFAIFDCDFRPRPCFLKQLLPSLQASSKNAVIQAVWSFSNAERSLLTRLQETLLSYHFYGEQQGRYRLGLPFNFNGSAGVWSGHALSAVGGWRANSVTEDLYLSYKVQLKGYSIVLCSELECLSELPSRVSHFLIQQRRWAKGNGQVLRLMFKEIVSSRLFRFKDKLDVIYHLSGYGLAGWISGFYLALPLLIPLRGAWIRETSYFDPLRFVDAVLWFVIILLFFLVFSSRSNFPRLSRPVRLVRAFVLFVFAPCLSGLTLGSYLQGLTGSMRQKKNLVFHRTPKTEASSGLRLVDRLFLSGLLLFFSYCSMASLRYDLFALSVFLILHSLSAGYLLFHDSLCMLRALDWSLWPKPLSLLKGIHDKGRL